MKKLNIVDSPARRKIIAKIGDLTLEELLEKHYSPELAKVLEDFDKEYPNLKELIDANVS